jgi:hypothetical protein
MEVTRSSSLETSLERPLERPLERQLERPLETPLERPLERPLSKEERKKLDYDSLFPKTLVLFITLHGEICVWDDVRDEPVDFEIPESIHSLFKLNLAPSGVTAVMSALDSRFISIATRAYNFEKKMKSTEENSSLEKIRKIINDQLSQSDLSESGIDYLHYFMQELQLAIKHLYHRRMLMPSTKEKFPEETDTLPKAVNLHMWLETPITHYTETYMKSQNQFVHFFPPPNKKMMTNKVYSTGDPRTEHSATPFNHAIIALNLNGGWKDILPDILSSKKLSSRSTQRTLVLQTSDILDFLSNIKDPEGKPIVENVLIIDTSCANFQDENQEHKEKLTRLSDELGHGGKRSKRRRRKKSKSIRKKSKSIRKKSKSLRKKSKSIRKKSKSIRKKSKRRV